MYGIKLYKKGYASKVILSSGDTEGFSEAEVMKMMARIKGVQKEDIILEEESINPFENIRITKIILDKNGRIKL